MHIFVVCLTDKFLLPEPLSVLPKAVPFSERFEFVEVFDLEAKYVLWTS